MALRTLTVGSATKKLKAGHGFQLAMCGNWQPNEGRQGENDVSKAPHAYYGCQKANKCSIKDFHLRVFIPRDRNALAITETELRLIAAPAVMGLKSTPNNG